MPYQKSLDIEQRLQAVLQLIGTGRYSTPALARTIGVSIPTISRCVQALRQRGYTIRAVKDATGWKYVVGSRPDAPVETTPGDAGRRHSTTKGAR